MPVLHHLLLGRLPAALRGLQLCREAGDLRVGRRRGQGRRPGAQRLAGIWPDYGFKLSSFQKSFIKYPMLIKDLEPTSLIGPVNHSDAIPPLACRPPQHSAACRPHTQQPSTHLLPELPLIGLLLGVQHRALLPELLLEFSPVPERLL